MAMLALQAVTPGALAEAVAGVTLAEARKLVAQIHRGDAIAASSAVRRSAAAAVRAAGDGPAAGLVAGRAAPRRPRDPRVHRRAAVGAPPARRGVAAGAARDLDRQRARRRAAVVDADRRAPLARRGPRRGRGSRARDRPRADVGGDAA